LFGTRHTLSAQDDPVRGTGATRDWIAAELTCAAATTPASSPRASRPAASPSRTSDFAQQHQEVRVEGGVLYGDLPRFCDFAFIARVAQVNAAALWSLARAPGRPQNELPDTTVLTNDSTRTWDGGTEPDLAGNEVVWRPTTSPAWTHVVPVGRTTRTTRTTQTTQTTQTTLDLSEDDVVLGVRAVHRSGHRSPAVFPFPST